MFCSIWVVVPWIYVKWFCKPSIQVWFLLVFSHRRSLILRFQKIVIIVLKICYFFHEDLGFWGGDDPYCLWLMLVGSAVKIAFSVESYWFHFLLLQLLSKCCFFRDFFCVQCTLGIADDWSAFRGNPVKFGLGLVSILFDIVFIIQHYVLYRNRELHSVSSYDDIGTQSAGATSNMSDDSEYGSTVPIRQASGS